MGLQLGLCGEIFELYRSRAKHADVDAKSGHGCVYRGELEGLLPPGDELEINLLRQLGVEQSTVLGTRRKMDAIAPAQFVERVARTRDPAFRDLDRVDCPRIGDRLSPDAMQLGV